MIRKSLILSSILTLMVFAGFSCENTAPPKDGGIFKSSDTGKTWNQKVKVDDKNNISTVSVIDIVIDQADPRKILIGTEGLGVYVSTDAGETWSTGTLSFGTVNSIVIDPADSNIVYVAGAVGDVGKIYKSLDGGTAWEEIFSETKPGTTVNSLDIDWFDSRIIYAGTSEGAILKSKDSGRSWVAVKFLDYSVNHTMVSLKDSRIVFASSGGDLYKSTDGGESFYSLEKALEKFKIRGDIHDLASHRTFKDIIYMSSNIGLLKSEDVGETWTEIRLLTLPSRKTISKIALDKLNPNIVYIGFDTNIYKSEDEGKNWSVYQFTTAEIGAIAVDTHTDFSNIYVGVIYEN